MVTPVTPSREALARIANGDNRLLIALEQLFKQAGVTTPDNVDDLQHQVGLRSQIGGDMQTDTMAFDINAPWPRDVVGTTGWNPVDDTLDVVLSGGVTLQVGQEVHAMVQNSTGSTLTNGSVVGVAGAGVNSRVLVSNYIADGTRTSLNIAGILTQDIPTGTSGKITVWGYVRDINTTGTPVGEVWSIGQTLYASPTVAGRMTTVKPTAPNVVLPVAFVLKVGATDGVIFVRPTIEQQQYYGGFSKSNNAALSAPNTATPITLTDGFFTNGVSLGTPASRIVFANAGLYSISANFQFQSTNTSAKDVFFWYRKNGVDVPNSTYTITNNLGSGYFTAARSRSFSILAGDYIELYWACTSTNMTLIATPATAFCPASPSVDVEVFQIQQ